jgi:hypothetical protein
MFTAKNRSVKEYFCLNDDGKPTAGIANGSTCTEIDTGDVYCFDEENSTWYKIAAGPTPAE